MNILFCSAGQRVQLLSDFRSAMGGKGCIVATDMSRYAPALYVADRYYLVPQITAPEYIDSIRNICRKEHIDAIMTLIDPEIEILAKNRKELESEGAVVFAPSEQTAHICFDKFLFYQHMKAHGLRVVPSFDNIESARAAVLAGEISYPVFVKPRTGSGSVGARIIESEELLIQALNADRSLMIQEYMKDAQDLDADVYVDRVSREAVSIFTKKKLKRKIGGASKTVSFYDSHLTDFIRQVVSILELCGPCDMDLFYRDGTYYISEINPRFGGACLHAFGAGVDFVSLIRNNLKGCKNEAVFGNYEEDIVMMMYDSVIIRKFRNDAG